MKRSSIVWQFALLAVIGCSGKTDPVATTPTAPAQPAQTQAVADTNTTDAAQTPESGETATTFVSLKVPNMVWGGCAASVRGDLKKIAGVTDIQTDVPGRLATFKISDPNVDYKAELATFAKSNTHLADYTIQ